MAAINSVYTQKRATTALLPLLYESLEPLRSKLPLVSVVPPEPAERPEGGRFPRHRAHRGGRRRAVDPLSRIHQATPVAAQPLLRSLPMADRTALEPRNHAVTTPSV